MDIAFVQNENHANTLHKPEPKLKAYIRLQAKYRVVSYFFPKTNN